MAEAQVPIISVIMPAFNTGRYISESIESVINQSVDFWELLIVDDGSSDETFAIAAEYAHKFQNKIYLYTHPESKNKGSSASRNLALKYAKGEYIAFLDSDDIWLASSLETYYNAIVNRNDIEMVYGGAQWWYSWNENSHDQKVDEVISITTPAVTFEPPELISKTLLNGELHMPCMCSLLVRRRAVERVCGFETEFTRIFEDQVLYTKIFLHFNVEVIPGYYARYRQHPQSTCQLVKAEGNLLGANENFLKWVRSYLIEEGCKDKHLWNNLNRALSRFNPARKLLRKAKRLLNSIRQQKIGT